LEEDNQAYFDWIKDLHKSGLIEFWNHGYSNRKATDKTGEFEGCVFMMRSEYLKKQGT
jgi:hypothetical protein